MVLNAGFVPHGWVHAVDHGFAVLAIAIFCSALSIRSFSIAGHRSYALPPFCSSAALNPIGARSSLLNDHQFTRLFIQQMLHPIETLDIFALICLNERVQFAICDAI